MVPGRVSPERGSSELLKVRLYAEYDKAAQRKGLNGSALRINYLV